MSARPPSIRLLRRAARRTHWLLLPRACPRAADAARCWRGRAVAGRRSLPLRQPAAADMHGGAPAAEPAAGRPAPAPARPFLGVRAKCCLPLLLSSLLKQLLLPSLLLGLLLGRRCGGRGATTAGRRHRACHRQCPRRSLIRGTAPPYQTCRGPGGHSGTFTEDGTQLDGAVGVDMCDDALVAPRCDRTAVDIAGCSIVAAARLCALLAVGIDHATAVGPPAQSLKRSAQPATRSVRSHAPQVAQHEQLRYAAENHNRGHAVEQ